MGGRAFFVAISLALAAAAWPGQPSDVEAAVPSVPLRLPYDADEQVRWTGGPHVYYCSRNCLLPIGDDTLNLYRTGEGSGLDFSSGGNFDVLAMAAGHVIYASGQAADDPDRVACSTAGLGCRIATRLADGTVIVYAHLRDGSVHVHAGDEPEQGRVLAQAGQSGGQPYVHLHIDWRDGTGSWPDGSDGNCGQDDPRCFYGNPIGWEGHPLGLDGYRIWPFLCTDPIRDAPQADCSGDGEVAFDYDGSATVGQVKTIEACTFGDGLAGTTRRHASVAVDATYRQTTCDTTEPGMPTQFAGRGAIGAGAGDGTFAQGTVDPGGGYLVSTNRRIESSTATDRPTVVWVKRGTTKDASHVPYGEPVTLTTRFHGDVDVAEVRFTAYYPDWPNAKDARKLGGFDPKATWRTLKVCRPKTKGCSWDGDRQAATVSYTWDPTVGEKKRSITGVPKADPAITLRSTKCVPVTLGIDAVDASGTITSAPGGKIAQRCDAKAKGLARTVYLDPLAPPVAPGSVTLQCKRNTVDRGVKWCQTSNLGPITLVWQDLSDNEDGYNVYARYTGFEYLGDACADGPVRTRDRTGPWMQVGSVGTGVTSWRVAGTSRRSLPSLPLPSWGMVQAMEFRVEAFNRAGESRTMADAKVAIRTEIYCGPG